jgi:hypothetical protein
LGIPLYIKLNHVFSPLYSQTLIILAISLLSALSELLHVYQEGIRTPSMLEFRSYETLLYPPEIEKRRKLFNDFGLEPDPYLQATKRIAPLLLQEDYFLLDESRGTISSQDFSLFLRMIQSSTIPIGVAFVATLHLDRLRRDALRNMIVSGYVNKSTGVVATPAPIESMISLLGFLDAEECERFLSYFGLIPDAAGRYQLAPTSDWKQLTVDLKKPQVTKLHPHFLDKRVDSSAGFDLVSFISGRPCEFAKNAIPLNSSKSGSEMSTANHSLVNSFSSSAHFQNENSDNNLAFPLSSVGSSEVLAFLPPTEQSLLNPLSGVPLNSFQFRLEPKPVPQGISNPANGAPMSQFGINLQEQKPLKQEHRNLNSTAQLQEDYSQNFPSTMLTAKGAGFNQFSSHPASRVCSANGTTEPEPKSFMFSNHGEVGVKQGLFQPPKAAGESSNSWPESKQGVHTQVLPTQSFAFGTLPVVNPSVTTNFGASTSPPAIPVTSKIQAELSTAFNPPNLSNSPAKPTHAQDTLQTSQELPLANPAQATTLLPVGWATPNRSVANGSNQLSTSPSCHTISVQTDPVSVVPMSDLSETSESEDLDTPVPEEKQVFTLDDLMGAATKRLPVKNSHFTSSTSPKRIKKQKHQHLPLRRRLQESSTISGLTGKATAMRESRQRKQALQYWNFRSRISRIARSTSLSYSLTDFFNDSDVASTLDPSKVYRISDAQQGLAEFLFRLQIRDIWPELLKQISRLQTISREAYSPWTVVAATNHVIQTVSELFKLVIEGVWQRLVAGIKNQLIITTRSFSSPVDPAPTLFPATFDISVPNEMHSRVICIGYFKRSLLKILERNACLMSPAQRNHLELLVHDLPGYNLTIPFRDGFHQVLTTLLECICQNHRFIQAWDQMEQESQGMAVSGEFLLSLKLEIERTSVRFLSQLSWSMDQVRDRLKFDNI